MVYDACHHVNVSSKVSTSLLEKGFNLCLVQSIRVQNNEQKITFNVFVLKKKKVMYLLTGIKS